MTRMPDKNNAEQEPNLHEQVEALETTRQRSDQLNSTAHRRFAIFATILALLIGAAHAVPVIFRPSESLVAFWVAMGVYALAVLVLMVWYLRTRSAMPTGGNKRYIYGLTGTFVLYGAAALLWPYDSLYRAVMFGLVIAIPLILAAWVKRP